MAVNSTTLAETTEASVESLVKTTAEAAFTEETTSQGVNLMNLFGLYPNETWSDHDDPANGVSAWNTSDQTTTLETVTDKPFLPWDNPDNIISLATFLLLEKACQCGVNPVLFLLGVPGNILNCVVFARQGLKDRMNLLLFSLALVDMAFVALFFLVGSYCLLGHFRPDLEQWWKYFTRKYLTGLYRGFLYSSGCLTMVIAVDRCVCVTLPIRAAKLISTRTVAILIAAIVIIIQAACSLYPLELKVGSRVDNSTGQVFFFLTLTQFYADHQALYNIVENTLLMIVIPFFTFIVVTSATAVTVVNLKRAIAWRVASTVTDHGNFTNRQQRSLSKILVLVCSVYIITAAPNVALGLSRLTVPGFLPTERYANIFLASHLLYLMLAMVNSSVNCLIYVTRSSRYRQELRRLFLAQPRVERCSSSS